MYFQWINDRRHSILTDAWIRCISPSYLPSCYMKSGRIIETKLTSDTRSKELQFCTRLYSPPPVNIYLFVRELTKGLSHQTAFRWDYLLSGRKRKCFLKVPWKVVREWKSVRETMREMKRLSLTIVHNGRLFPFSR